MMVAVANKGKKIIAGHISLGILMLTPNHQSNTQVST